MLKDADSAHCEWGIFNYKRSKFLGETGIIKYRYWKLKLISICQEGIGNFIQSFFEGSYFQSVEV